MTKRHIRLTHPNTLPAAKTPLRGRVFWAGLQTRLLLPVNKASFHCKQGFFSLQTRLLFYRSKIIMDFKGNIYLVSILSMQKANAAPVAGTPYYI